MYIGSMIIEIILQDDILEYLFVIKTIQPL